MPITGSISLSGDKSISHRALMLASLAGNGCVIHNLSSAADVLSTRRCLEVCGVSFSDVDGSTVVEGGELKNPAIDLDCGNSGTTARLLLGLLAGQGISARLVGDESLSRRPMNRVVEPLREMGAHIISSDGHLPIELKPGRLKGKKFRPAVASAQVKSALLLAGLGADGSTTVTERLPTRDHTENMLAGIGVNIRREGLVSAVDKPAQPLNKFEITVPGDPSTGAFYAAAAAVIPDSELILENVLLNKTRTGFYSALEQMGAVVEYSQTGRELGEPSGNIIIRHRSLKGICLGADDIPALVDEIPVLAVIATQARGITEIRGAEELRVKESDRIAALSENLKVVGAAVEEHGDGLTITGPTGLQGGRIKTFNDHRIAMAFSIADLLTEEIIQPDNPDCISISAPEFTTILKKIYQGNQR